MIQYLKNPAKIKMANSYLCCLKDNLLKGFVKAKYIDNIQQSYHCLPFVAWTDFVHNDTAGDKHPDNTDRLPSIHVHRGRVQEGKSQEKHRAADEPAGKVYRRSG